MLFAYMSLITVSLLSFLATFISVWMMITFSRRPRDYAIPGTVTLTYPVTTPNRSKAQAESQVKFNAAHRMTTSSCSLSGMPALSLKGGIGCTSDTSHHEMT